MQARSSNAEDIIPAVRVWGPIKAAQATAAGALAAASSVLLKPLQPPPELLDQVRALIPSTVLPHKDDDAAETLKRRVQASSFFHTTWILCHGHGKGGRYVDLNSTAYAQPRRIQWARPSEAVHIDEDGDRVVRLPCYTHYYSRSPLLAMCEVMPPTVTELVRFGFETGTPLPDVRIEGGAEWL